MKKIILTFVVLVLIGCTKKEQPVNTEIKNDQTKAIVSKWKTYQEKNPMDDSLSIVTSIDAEEILESKKPILALRCMENKFDIFFVLDNIVKNIPKDYKTSLVTIRFDSDKAKDYSMRIADGMDVIFFKNPIDEVNTLLKHNKLTIRFNMVGGKQQIANFDLNGLSEAIKPIKEACNIQNVKK